MATVFNEKAVSATSPVQEKAVPENEGAGYAIVMGVTIPVGGGPGGLTKKTSDDTVPLAEKAVSDQGVHEKGGI